MSPPKSGPVSCSVWPLMHPAVLALFAMLGTVSAATFARGAIAPGTASLLLLLAFFFSFSLRSTLTLERSRGELRLWTRRWPLDGVRDAVPIERVVDVVMHERADVIQGKPRVQRSIALELSDNTRLRLVDVWFSGEGYRAVERLKGFLASHRER